MSGGTGSTQYFSLRWNNHPVNMVSVFTTLYQAESLVDVSLAAEGKQLQAHKVVLSACSDYFQLLFAANPCKHPIVILKDVAFEDLQTVVKFMYHGCVNVSSDKLPAVLKTADALQIKGLEKNNELMSSYLGTSPSRQASLLSVPGQTRQPSTESLPEYLQRSRSDGGYYPHRAHSAESRGMSFESPLDVSGRPKRLHSPPGSPAAGPSGSAAPAGGSGSYARKKFRNRSENTNSQGTSAERSVEQQSDQSSGDRAAESPPPGVKEDASSTPGYQGDTEHIAKKKRAMFQARKAGSSSGSKSSEMHNSSDGRTDKKSAFESQSSSSLSISHSSDREEAGGQVKDENTLQVPSIAQSRTMVRAASASEVQHHSALTTKFKRGRFLQRQQCQEAAEEAESSGPVTRSEPPPSPPPPQQLVKQHSSPLLPSQSYSSPHNSPPPAPPPKEEPRDPLGSPPQAPQPAHHAPPPARQPSLDPLCGLDSIPLLYSRLPPFRPTLPSVRITPEEQHPSPPQHELVPHPHHSPTPAVSPTPSPGLLYPGVAAYEQVSPPPSHLAPHHHPTDKKPGMSSHLKQPPHHNLPQPHLSVMTNNNPGPGYPPPHPQPSASLSPVGRQLQYNSHNTMEQFGHCPKAREGPALSCNFCWNTTDGSGRILRRKTKYHCPECQTNLCIVPCFQQYHEAMDNENAVIH